VAGLLLHQMLVGRLPFASDDEAQLVLQHVRDDPPPLRAQSPDIPDHLAWIVHRALAKDPAKRFQNGGEMAEVLSLHLGTGPGRRAPQGGPQREVPLGRQLVVPPVPGAAASWSRPSRPGMDTSVEVDDLKSEARVDWIIVALLVVGIIAVLGLIPLWRSVYRRYAVPTMLPPSGWNGVPRPEPASLGPGLATWRDEVLHVGKLDDSRSVWYNAGMECGVSCRGANRETSVTSSARTATCRLGSLAYGPLHPVDYTGIAQIPGGTL
jgi:hypothetical protein